MSTKLRGGQHVKDVGLIPKTYSLSCNFTVLHEQELGFGQGKTFRRSAYPYGFINGKDGEQTLQQISNMSRPYDSSLTDAGSSNQETPAEILEARYQSILKNNN